MTLRYYYRDNDGDVVEIADPSRIRRTGTEASYQAEEGAVGTWEIEVDDPDGTFNVRGFRIVYAQEDEAIADDQHGIIGVWYTTDRSISRLSPSSPAKRTGEGRTWRIQLNDLNTRLSWRINVGNDCDRTGIDETDLQTVAWLISTNEMSWLDDDTTYIDTTDGVDMSENRNYTGQTLLDVLDDCAQTSGRNYGLLWEYSGDEDSPIAIKLWYKYGASEDYASTKKINNQPGAGTLDLTGDVYYPSLDATLSRSPSRVAWGVYQLYDGGAIYQTLASTAERFNKIDVTGRGENVKSEASANQRAGRYLRTVSNVETDRIDVSVMVAPEDVNSILPFHRLQVFFEHLPGYDELDDYDAPVYQWMRVVERTVRDIAPDRYELGLTLMAPSLDEFPDSEGGGTVDGSIQALLTGASGPYGSGISGPLYWDRTGDEIGWPPEILTNGPFTFVSSGQSWPPWEGIQITADGILSEVTLVASAIGVPIDANDPYTVIWELLLNDGVIASQSIGPITADGASGPTWGSWGPSVVAVNVPVSNGDVISGRLTCSPVFMELFRSPLGINPGVNWNRIRIIGGIF